MILTGPTLAFTPTSVMRKTAAERRDSDPRPTVPELKVTPGKDESLDTTPGSMYGLDKTPPSPGRPIVKKESNRPVVLDLAQQHGQGRLPAMPACPLPPSPRQQMGPAISGYPGMPHNNPLLYLQNQPMPGVSATMLCKYSTVLASFVNIPSPND